MAGTQCKNNIEIITGLSDSERLLHKSRITDNTSNKLVIQKVIAGDHGKRNVSVGDAILDPDAPLSVRRDSIVHVGNGNNYIQTWYCDDTLIASLDCDGNFDTAGSSTVSEGILTSNLSAPSASATDVATATIDVYKDGAFTGESLTIHNRDKSLTATAGVFVVVQKIGSEYRPVWVGCS